MSDGGAIVNEVPVTIDGVDGSVTVVVSGDSVEIGDHLVFSREALLFALGAAAEPG